MPCYSPIRAWRGHYVNPETGKRPLVFSPKSAFDFNAPIDLPCGKCVGCRLEKSRQWAMRCMCEAAMNEENCFVTLTYDDDHMPVDRSVNKKHAQDFMKRLRYYYPDKTIKYYLCGEYGDKTDRPHYHVLLFNLDFFDKKLYSIKNGNRLYTSARLESIWGHGFCPVGDLTFDSAAYTARYVMKKINGDMAHDHYKRIDLEFGYTYFLEPEFALMSRRNPIGKSWYDNFRGDCYPADFLVVNGRKVGIPKYFDKLFSAESEEEFERIKKNRKFAMYEDWENNTLRRLTVREAVKNSQITLLKREFENA